MSLPEELKVFIEAVPWTFANTYAKTWPHEYIVRGKVDEALFVRFVKHIRETGYVGTFYDTSITYFDANDRTYWTMGAPLDETIIINRCRVDQSYESRLRDGTLPDSDQKR